MKPTSRYRQIIILSCTFFVLMIVVALFHEDGILTVHRLEKQLTVFESENEALKLENQKTRQEIVALKSEPFEIERIAREKLNLVKPGETVYQIVHEEKNPPAPE